MAEKKIWLRGVYRVIDLDALEAGFTDPENKDHYYIKYIGSTHHNLEKLEDNHRNCWEYWPGEDQTDFRHALKDRGARWVFEWLIEPREVNEYTIMIEEGVMIRYFKPSLNKKNPWGQFPVLPRLQGKNKMPEKYQYYEHK